MMNRDAAEQSDANISNVSLDHRVTFNGISIETDYSDKIAKATDHIPIIATVNKIIDVSYFIPTDFYSAGKMF